MAKEILRELKHDDLIKEGLTEQEIKILSEKNVLLFKSSNEFTLMMGKTDDIGSHLSINDVRDFINQPMTNLE